MKKFGYIILLILIIITVLWIYKLTIRYILKKNRPDNFDDWMGQNFRFIISGIILLGIWSGLLYYVVKHLIH